MKEKNKKYAEAKKAMIAERQENADLQGFTLGFRVRGIEYDRISTAAINSKKTMSEFVRNAVFAELKKVERKSSIFI